MASVRFLGTGPARGRPGRGRSRRKESSIVVTSEDGAILIDVTRDFAAQARALERVDLVLVTHAHRDASGGVPQLERWLGARPVPAVPLLAARGTLAALRRRHVRLDHLALRAIRSRATRIWRGWRISALAVPHALDCTTYAWRLDHRSGSLVYASDVARLTPELASFSAGSDLLVIDGAMWCRKIYTHLEIQSALPVLGRWPVRRVLFTQLGRSTPPHGRLEAWLRARAPHVGAAYDGLELELEP